MFGLTHFKLQKYTFIDVYCQQVLVADGFKVPSFQANLSNKEAFTFQHNLCFCYLENSYKKLLLCLVDFGH